MSDATVDWTLRHGRSVTLSALFYDCTERLVKLDVFHLLVDLAVSLSANDRVSKRSAQNSCTDIPNVYEFIAQTN